MRRFWSRVTSHVTKQPTSRLDSQVVVTNS
jgi:hypothetical protein